jgi:hypothetical protein
MRIQEFDYSVNLLQSILWQYNEAEHLKSLISQKQLWVNKNQTEFWSNWYNDVFNLQTANQFGLVVWSIILGIPLHVNIYDNNKSTFGFIFVDPPITDPKGFQIANFDRSTFAQGASLGLTLEEQRILLKLRYFKLVSTCAIPEINTFFEFVFKDKWKCYMLDGLDMTITFVYPSIFPTILLYWIKNFDMIPRQAGVLLKFVISDIEVFGFGPLRLNFERGQFAPNTSKREK